MEHSPRNQTKVENIPAIERATGRSWSEWLRMFQAADAAKLPHPEVVKIARAAMPDSLRNPDWWAQGAAIAYEQQIGKRVPGQSSTGEYRVGASKRISSGRDEAIERWVALHADQPHLGHSFVNARSSRTGVRTFWRASLEGAGKLEVAASEKGDGKSLIAIQHTALKSESEIERWRAHWKESLGRLSA